MDRKDPEAARAYNRAYRAAHRAEHREYMRAYNAANRDTLRACHAAHRAAHREERRAQTRAYRAACPEAFMLADARRRAKRYGVPCTLERTDVCALLAPMTCAVTGLALVRNTGGKPGPLSPSLDRIIPARGYVPGNVRLVAHRFNLLRGTDPVANDAKHTARLLAELEATR